MSILIKLQNFLLKVLMILFSNSNCKISPNKIAIYRFGSLGDSIVSMPALFCIKKLYPYAHIDIICRSEKKGLVNLSSLIDKRLFMNIYDFSEISYTEFKQNIKNSRYDLWIELSSPGVNLVRNISKLFFLKTCKIKAIYGLEVTPGNSYISSKLFRSSYPFIRESDRLKKSVLSIKKNALLKKATSDHFLLNSTSSCQEKVVHFCESAKLNIHKIIVISPCSKKPAGMWDSQNWKRLLSKLLDLEFNCVLVGGKDDKEYIDTILSGFEERGVISIAGKFSIKDSQELIKLSNLVVCVDSGPMHLSYALNKRVISIFSSRDYKNKWYPPKESGILLRSSVDCSPCFKDICPYNNKCMQNISVEMVFDAVKKELSI